MTTAADNTFLSLAISSCTKGPFTNYITLKGWVNGWMLRYIKRVGGCIIRYIGQNARQFRLHPRPSTGHVLFLLYHHGNKDSKTMFLLINVFKTVLFLFFSFLHVFL